MIFDKILRYIDKHISKYTLKNTKGRAMNKNNSENNDTSWHPHYRFELTRFSKYMIKDVDFDKYILFNLYVRYGYVPGTFICYYTEERDIIFIRNRYWTNHTDNFCLDKEWEPNSSSYLDKTFVPNADDYPATLMENIELNYHDETQEPVDLDRQELCDALIKNIENDIEKYYYHGAFHFDFYITSVHQIFNPEYILEISRAIMRSDLLMYTCENWLQYTGGPRNLNIYFDYTRCCTSPGLLPIKKNLLSRARKRLLNDDTHEAGQCAEDNDMAALTERLEQVAEYYEAQLEIFSQKLADMATKLLDEISLPAGRDGMEQMLKLQHVSKELTLMSFELMRVRTKRMETTLKDLSSRFSG